MVQTRSTQGQSWPQGDEKDIGGVQ